MLIITSEPIITNAALYSSEIYLLCVYFSLSKFSNIFWKHFKYIAAKWHMKIFFLGDKKRLGWKTKAKDVRFVPKVAAETVVEASHLTCLDSVFLFIGGRFVTQRSPRSPLAEKSQDPWKSLKDKVNVSEEKIDLAIKQVWEKLNVTKTKACPSVSQSTPSSCSAFCSLLQDSGWNQRFWWWRRRRDGGSYSW